MEYGGTTVLWDPVVLAFIICTYVHGVHVLGLITVQGFVVLLRKRAPHGVFWAIVVLIFSFDHGTRRTDWLLCICFFLLLLGRKTSRSSSLGFVKLGILYSMYGVFRTEYSIQHGALHTARSTP